jgi:hypothetical protein
MTDQPLSTATEAVWHAYETANCDPYLIDPRRAGVAAALRVAADQVDWNWEPRLQLLDIVNELEAQ